MKQNYFLKLAFFILLSLISSFNLKAQLNTGDIALIAYNADGGDDFAFVALVDIPANESIYFRKVCGNFILIIIIFIHF